MAGIDPSIILRTQPIQVADPLERYGKSLALKNLMQQGETQDRAIADEDAVRQAYKEAGGDSTRLRALLQQGGQYKPLQALDRADLERREKESTIGKNNASADKSKADVHIRNLEHGAALLSTAKDQPTYENALRVGVITGVFSPEAVSKFPQEYKPETVGALINAGKTETQRALDQRAREQQAETGRHNLASEATARGQLGVAQGNLGLSRERLNFEQAQPRGTYDPERGVVVDPRNATATPVTMDGQPLAPRQDANQRKELSSIDAQANTVAEALKSVKATPDAFGLVRGAATAAGAVPEALAMRNASPEANKARAFVYNVVSKVINERAGAAQSAQELARLRGFLPSEYDNAQVIDDKLTGFQSYLAEQRKAYAPGGASGGWTIKAIP